MRGLLPPLFGTLLLLTAGCLPSAPEARGIKLQDCKYNEDDCTPEARGIKLQDCKYKEDDCDPYEEHIIEVFNQSKAMFTAQYHVEDHYNQDFGDLWADATVYWTDTKCPKNGQYSVVYGKECYYGIMWSCDEMYVALSNGNPERTTGSALLHEFGHCLHMSMGLGGDVAHVDDEFWSVIAEAQEVAKDRGW